MKKEGVIIHVCLLDANKRNSESLKLSTGEQINIAVKNMFQL
jgi:hypothetical protein